MRFLGPIAGRSTFPVDQNNNAYWRYKMKRTLQILAITGLRGMAAKYKVTLREQSRPKPRDTANTRHRTTRDSTPVRRVTR